MLWGSLAPSWDHLARFWQMLLPQKSSSDFVSEINLEMFSIHFSLHLPSPPASSLLPYKADKGEWKATRSRVTADTKPTASTDFHTSRQSSSTFATA